MFDHAAAPREPRRHRRVTRQIGSHVACAVGLAAGRGAEAAALGRLKRRDASQHRRGARRAARSASRHAAIGTPGPSSAFLPSASSSSAVGRSAFLARHGAQAARRLTSSRHVAAACALGGRRLARAPARSTRVGACRRATAANTAAPNAIRRRWRRWRRRTARRAIVAIVAVAAGAAGAAGAGSGAAAARGGGGAVAARELTVGGDRRLVALADLPRTPRRRRNVGARRVASPSSSSSSSTSATGTAAAGGVVAAGWRGRRGGAGRLYDQVKAARVYLGAHGEPSVPDPAQRRRSTALGVGRDLHLVGVQAPVCGHGQTQQRRWQRGGPRAPRAASSPLRMPS